MPYRQLRTANTNIKEVYSGGKLQQNWAGLCLACARTIYTVMAKYDPAWQAWEKAAFRHANRDFPRNVYFPIWFSHIGTYNGVKGQYGHVVVCFVDNNGKLTLWSSPAKAGKHLDVYNSIAEVERIYKSTFVGWTEDINTVKVIEHYEEDNMTRYEQIQMCGITVREKWFDKPVAEMLVGRPGEPYSVVQKFVAEEAGAPVTVDKTKQLLASQGSGGGITEGTYEIKKIK